MTFHIESPLIKIKTIAFVTWVIIIIFVIENTHKTFIYIKEKL